MPSEASQSFRGHSNYLEAFARITSSSGLLPQLPELLAEVSSRYLALQGPLDTAPVSVDLGAVQRCLAHAWGTELLQAMAMQQFGDEDELVRLSNTWGAVQTYYVGYHMTQALWVAKGNPRPTNHPRTQRIHCDLWVKPKFSLPPWSFAVGRSGPIKLPHAATIDPKVHPLSKCTKKTSWSYAAQVLRTTRDDALKSRLAGLRESKRKERRNAWLEDEGRRREAGRRPRKQRTFPLPRLSVQNKAEANESLRPYTMIDYLYRVRVKTNYEDSAVFTDGPGADRVISARVAAYLTALASATALAHEARIIEVVGWSRFRGWIDDWIARCIPDGLSVGASLRRGLYPL